MVVTTDCRWVLKLFIFTVLFQQTVQNDRTKRQIQPELPQIVTQNGHLVFQTGTNHNISFTAVTGGFINVNGENLAVITQTVKDNKLAIDQIQTAPTASPAVESRLSQLEDRLNNLQPTGEVQNQLAQLNTRTSQIPQDIGTRLTTVEDGLANLQPTGQVQTMLTRLNRRVNQVRSQSRRTSRLSRSVRRNRRTIGQLQTTVQQLQTLLTTDECDSNPCRNGGTCVDSYGSFFCRCPSTFQGPTCDVDVNECAIYAGTDLGCQNGATCSNTHGGFTCQCAPNYHGIRCTETHEDCNQASATELCGHGTCINIPRTQGGQARYRCICNDGWTTSGGSEAACIVDVDECTSGRTPCSQNPLVPCINLPGSFTCGSCPAGYSGNGFTCVDINECANNNGGCSLAPRVECINTHGSFQCGPCPSGFQGDGTSCTWVGVCNQNNGGCHSQAACTESPGFQGRICTCPPGYVGNGVGSGGCTPQSPTTGPCGSTPCQNGAVCQTSNSNSYHCVCQPGYSGTNCESNINECSSNPCQNGGSCSDQVNGYACQCTESYTGANCEIEQQTCGGLLNGESGTFRYPLDPGSQYPHEVSCAWVVTTTASKILMITFPSFNVEAHSGCAYDFLQLNDGPTAASHPLGRFCGNTIPNNNQPINSTHNKVYFWFYSDASVAGDGFSVQWRSADPVCGGNLVGADHGDISSPGYPGLYPINRDCVWTISVSPGKKILFSFATLAIETHPDCNYDYLEIRDGGLDTSPVLQRFCNRTSPEPLSTTGPTAWIKFHSDASATDSGFHITYAAIAADRGCGGTYNSSTGILISPNYPNPYNHDASCVWVITVQAGEMIALTFTNMALEGTASCSYDFVEVRDGPDESSSLIGRYCGDFVPGVLTTTSNILYVKFRSDSSVTAAGFRATWRIACGGTFTAPTGTVHSPNYPNSYPSTRECDYHIVVATGNRVTLTFNAFDVEGEGTDSCPFDFLEVRDGGSASSNLLGKFCGGQIPPQQLSTYNEMFLKFVTDGSVQNLGFTATYETTDAGCGGHLTDATGTFESPGYPNQYPHGVNCTWYIDVSPGEVIRLTFNSFSMENHARCAYDYVSVYDNFTAVESSLLGRYCGNFVPPVLTSTDNMMTIRLRSDTSIAHEGFTASYVSINVSHVCGREMTESVGLITSPNWPQPYPHQRQCIWTINVAHGNQIVLNVTDFQLEYHPNCRYDFLEIRNGGFPSSPLLGRFCGNTIDRVIISHSNRMFLKLVTDASRTGPGFRIFYDATATGCGADLTSPSGSFVSPNYPHPYGHNAECFWIITTSRGSRIILTLVDIELELHSRCHYDYVEVRDTNAVGNLIGRYCGNTVPDPAVSSSNVMWIKYRTDYSVSGRGFHATYVSDCNTRVKGYSGVIESPNFPSPYPHNRNCSWVIETTSGNKVNLSFSHFDIESHSNCAYDYLQLRDGDSANSPLLGEYCGRSLPPYTTTSGNFAFVKFLSDFSVALNGFRLEYVTDGCGGYFTSQTGSFTSPNYPNLYPHRRVCEWTIAVQTGYYIQLRIENFDVEAQTNCLFDALEIYGGLSDQAPMLNRLCHRQSAPINVTTTGNQMFLRFKTDAMISGTGFQVSYRALTGGCGGNITASSGTIVSKNYPNNYPHNTDCVWLITVAETRSVTLNFTDFDVEGHTSCRYDFVAVYDGASRQSPQLVKHCGDSLPSPVIYQSSGNQMYIHMRSDTGINKRGFKADYITSCGGRLNAEQDGEVISPNYPGIYPRSLNCTWIITADHSSDRISLFFSHMDIEESADCVKDSLTVRDGNDEGAPVIGQYCGTSSPASVTSQGSAMVIQFVSDTFRRSSGFRIAYTKSTSACGGNLQSMSGTFNSPGYPNSYPINTECVWTVSVAPGNRVQLSFSFFNLEDHETCNTDYIEIHEGQLGGPLLGRFCGNQQPTNLTAYSGLWIKFRSDESGTGRGFQATYSQLFGGEITGSSGQIASPLYPNRYPHTIDHTWTVTAPIGMKIRVTFHVIDIEQSEGCIYDYVKFQDGGTDDSPVLRKYCGTTVPPVFMTTGNQMYVSFHTDWGASGQGFLFNWEATTDVLVTTPLPQVTTAVPGCGGLLNVTEVPQTVISPGYPNGYLHSLNCEWRLIAPQGRRLWLNITDIDLERHYSCRWDSLNIYNGPTTRSFQVGKFCGRTGNEEPMLSLSNQALMTFTTDGSVNRTGFSLQYKSVCGGQVTAPQGSLSSDNYPYSYPNNANCTWTVVVPEGRTIRVTFNTNFHIQGTATSCGGDYLKLLNGGTATSPPLGNSTVGSADGRYCGNAAPVVIETSSNELYAQFISDGSITATGFSFTYTDVSVTCGGQVTLNAMVTSGILTSPNYPQPYPQNVDCVWVIVAPANERIQIDFQDQFKIESHRDCNYDFVELRDGGTINSPLLSRVCGSTIPSTILSTGNVVYARFRTDSSAQQVGFKAQYKIATCGGRYVGNSGIITSPNYPGNYDNNMDCSWTVQVPTGHFITLSFTAFQTPMSSNCSSTDYLEVRDINSTGPILLTTCGRPSLQPLLTSDSYAHIRFVSNGARVSTGFSLRFEASVEECGGDVSGPTGILQSPNYPGQYPHRRLCRWKITVPQGRRITFTFTALNIEEHTRCSYDSVSILNGINHRGLWVPILDRFCGSTIPDVVETSGNTAEVVFRSDGSLSNGGFQLQYTSNNEQVCGGELTTSPGNITSPGYDGINNYTNNLLCVWTVRNPGNTNTSIQLKVNALDLEPHTRCYYDVLVILEGSSPSGTRLERLCGNNTIPPVLVTPASSLYVHFKTDKNKVGLGFHLSYTFTQCGGTLTSPSGVIVSPNYPQNYNTNDACAWIILAPEGTQIIVTVTDLNIETHANCEFDNLEIFNGQYASSPSIGRYCGTNKPATFRSQSNTLRIVFKSDARLSARGFRLSYYSTTQGCGGLIHSNTGNVTSPNYPGSYPHNTECVWDINVQIGYTVNMTFYPPFDMQHHGSCDNDYVEVSDTQRNGSLRRLGRWCENILPPSMISGSHQMQVKFRSDATTNGNGFSASWEAGCGGVITEPEGILISPGYHRSYGHNLLCNYTLDMDPQHYISLEFLDFDLEGNRRCRWDYVVVYAGNSSTGRQLGRFCGQTIPQTLSSLGKMFIQFRTDGSVAHKGFKARFSTSQCGGVYTSQTGVITIPTLSTYHNNMNCTWSITVATNKVIDFKFSTLEVEGHSRCRYDYIAIYDGPSTASPLIGQYCGNVLPTALIRTTGNTMTINFITDGSLTYGGFRGVYFETFGPAQNCGGILTAQSGHLTSTDADGDGMYENDLYCPWTIMADNFKVIRFTITGLNIENDPTCRYDSLKVYDGRNAIDPLVGTYCGTTAPPQYLSSSNFLFVIFETDSNIQGHGFNATYVVEEAACGGVFNSTSDAQTITSPGYPNAYGQEVRCRWTIDAPTTFDRVQVSMNALDLQNTPSCSPEFLEIKDSPLGYLGRAVHVCGSVLPPTFDSFGQTVQINYIGTGSGSTGFSLTFMTGTCNRNYTGSYGQIYSPLWPNSYPNRVSCFMWIIAPEGSTIALYFNSFYVESHSACRYDYLQVLNGTETASAGDRKMCGRSLPDPVFSDANILVLKFATDHSVTRTGFDITYTTTTQGSGCGGTIMGINGSLTSPGYPGNYTDSATCRWVVRAPARRVLTLTFTDLRVFTTPNCRTDYVMVYNGETDQGSPVGRYCGAEVPGPLLLSGNIAMVKYKSDGSGNSLAFRLTFTS